jgi:hypothetical protein
MHTKLIRHLSAAAILALACAVALAACGSSSKKPTSKARGDTLIAFSKCMRAHGVTNFPDPSGNGTINIDGTGINLQSPSFRAAQTTCFKLLPGGSLKHPPSAQQIKQATETSECMRKHGVTSFPDPTISTSSSLPDLNPSQYSSVENRGGIILAIPISINVASPVFTAARKACNFR